MSAELYPTRDRRGLLDAINRGRIHRSPEGHLVRHSRDFKSRVDAKVRDMVAAGWLTEHPDSERPLQLTEAGRIAMGVR